MPSEITDLQSDVADLCTASSTKFDVLSGLMEKAYQQNKSMQSPVKIQVKISLDNSEILWAYRAGKMKKGSSTRPPRHIIAKVTPQLKERTMQSAKNIKD